MRNMTKKKTLAAVFALAVSFVAGTGVGYIIGHSGSGNNNAKIGSLVSDSTVYAGISPGTQKPMYTTKADAPGVYTLDKAAAYCSALNADSHKDWRLPTKAELNVLYQNRNRGQLKGTFNETGSGPAGWYWSSSQTDDICAWGQRFSDGDQYYYGRSYYSSLRCVR
jgi:Protein of unknown function (DUF1566)